MAINFEHNTELIERNENMHSVRKISEDIYWVGGNSRNLNIIENLFPIKRGISYNSYLILDDKTALIDTVDFSMSTQFIENVQYVLGERTLDYLFLNHMEPDYFDNIVKLIEQYPEMKIVANEKTFQMISQFYDIDIENKRCVVGENDAVLLGKHVIEFCMAPMVH